MKGTTIFSEVDLSQWYLQVTLHYSLPDPRWGATMTLLHTSNHGSLPFGRVLPWSHKPNYQWCSVQWNISNNIWLWSTNMGKHIRQLHQILGTLQNNGIKLKLIKMLLWSTRNQRQGIRPDNSKIEAVTNTSRSKCASEVRSFLGLTNYSDTHLITAASHTLYTNWPRPQVPFNGEKNKMKAPQSSSKL